VSVSMEIIIVSMETKSQVVDRGPLQAGLPEVGGTGGARTKESVRSGWGRSYESPIIAAAPDMRWGSDLTGTL
jgi:hypothetical protein